MPTFPPGDDKNFSFSASPGSVAWAARAIKAANQSTQN